MPCAFASCSIDLRYAPIVSTFGGNAVNQRATLLPKVCARAVLRSMAPRVPNTRTLARRAGASLGLERRQRECGGACRGQQAVGRCDLFGRRRGPRARCRELAVCRASSRASALAAQVSAAKPRAALNAPTVRPVARAFAAREVANSSPFFFARASSVASCLPCGRRASAASAPRGATTSKWSTRSSAARVGASEVAVVRSGEKSGSSIIGPLSNTASRRGCPCLDRLSTKPDHSAAGAGVRWRTGLAS